MRHRGIDPYWFPGRDPLMMSIIDEYNVFRPLSWCLKQIFLLRWLNFRVWVHSSEFFFSFSVFISLFNVCAKNSEIPCISTTIFRNLIGFFIYYYLRAIQNNKYNTQLILLNLSLCPHAKWQPIINHVIPYKSSQNEKKNLNWDITCQTEKPIV